MAIKSRKELLEYIKADRLRYGYSLKTYIIGRIFSSENSRAIRLLNALRVTEYWHYRRNTNIYCKIRYAISKLTYSRLACKYDTYIAINTCGPGLWMPHMGGIVVNCRSMGSNCSITKGVVIGNRAGQDNIATIGDNCYFTLGCKVIGNITIGDNVIVAQNAVVTKDVESNTLVGGIPAKPIKKYKSISEIKI